MWGESYKKGKAVFSYLRKGYFLCLKKQGCHFLKFISAQSIFNPFLFFYIKINVLNLFLRTRTPYVRHWPPEPAGDVANEVSIFLLNRCCQWRCGGRGFIYRRSLFYFIFYLSACFLFLLRIFLSSLVIF